MADTSFRYALQNHLISMIETSLGSDITTVQKFLPTGEMPEDDFPCIMVNIRSWEEIAPGEIGINVRREITQWLAHIYYLDVSIDYDQAEAKRDKVMWKLERLFEEEPRLQNFASAPNSDSVNQYVYDCRVTNVLFDSSGQEGYYSFISELYLTVDTARN